MVIEISQLRSSVQILENIANIRVPLIAAIEGRAHVHSEYALLANVIVAAEGATFLDGAHFAADVYKRQRFTLCIPSRRRTMPYARHWPRCV